MGIDRHIYDIDECPNFVPKILDWSMAKMCDVQCTLAYFNETDNGHNRIQIQKGQ